MLELVRTLKYHTDLNQLFRTIANCCILTQSIPSESEGIKLIAALAVSDVIANKPPASYYPPYLTAYELAKSMKYPTIPSDLDIQLVPIDLSNGQSVAVPWWIPATDAKLDDQWTWVYVGACYITPYKSAQDAWEDACYDATSSLGLPQTELSYHSKVVQHNARILISSPEWWAV